MDSESFLNQPQKEYLKCPSCKTGFLDTRVKRSFLYKNILFFVKVKRYKCSACNHRQHVPYAINAEKQYDAQRVDLH